MSTILVPSDFSKNATDALDYAINLCKQMNSELIVFHCSHISAYALSTANTEEQMTRLLKEDEEHKMEKLQAQVTLAYQQQLNSTVPDTTRCMVSYNPLLVEKTMEIAKNNNVDLIVMGTHGASGITKFFFGSNTSIMIAKSDIPVMAIPENFQYTPLQHIVFASDLENLSVELSQIVPLAQSIESEIKVLYLDYGIDTEHIKIKNAEEVIENIYYKKIKLEVQKATIETSLVGQVKKYISLNKPECLVMFARERSLWDRLFFKGSKTEDISTAMSIPLISYKKK
ncbi:MAG TPA: universal stress protein [Ferruginibacter sp.]|nr:universal stress protein [Ferruginibacter sp.]